MGHNKTSKKQMNQSRRKRLALGLETRTRLRAISCMISHQSMHSVFAYVLALSIYLHRTLIIHIILMFASKHIQP